MSDISFRTLNYSDRSEVLEYTRLFWEVPAECGDAYTPERSPEFIKDWTDQAIEKEDEMNTFSGIALQEKTFVGIHTLRRFEEHAALEFTSLRCGSIRTLEDRALHGNLNPWASHEQKPMGQVSSTRTLVQAIIVPLP